MAIKLAKVQKVAAQPEKTFDELWMTFLQISAQNPNGPVRVESRIAAARTVDGKKELKRIMDKPFVIPDFFKAAESDPELLVIMGALLTKLKTMAGL